MQVSGLISRVEESIKTIAEGSRSCLLMLSISSPQASVPDAPAPEKKLWGGRFTGKTDPLMEKFNESLPFDRRMWAEDIRVSHSRECCRAMLLMLCMPCNHGLLTPLPPAVCRAAKPTPRPWPSAEF